MKNRLDELLACNRVGVYEAKEAVHSDVLESVLREICIAMKRTPNVKREILEIYYRSRNNLDAAGQIVKKFYGCRLPQEDLIWLDRCLRAALKKRPRRGKMPDKLRETLWQAQRKRCARCNRELALQDVQIDHRIPWDFVGDGLEQNYQALCPVCNEEKSNRVGENLRQALANGGRLKR